MGPAACGESEVPKKLPPPPPARKQVSSSETDVRAAENPLENFFGQGISITANH